MTRTRTTVAAIAVAGLVVVGCAGGSDDEPGLDRIDGPAQVDPDVQVGGSPEDPDR